MGKFFFGAAFGIVFVVTLLHIPKHDCEIDGGKCRFTWIIDENE